MLMLGSWSFWFGCHCFNPLFGTKNHAILAIVGQVGQSCDVVGRDRSETRAWSRVGARMARGIDAGPFRVAMVGMVVAHKSIAGTAT